MKPCAHRVTPPPVLGRARLPGGCTCSSPPPRRKGHAHAAAPLAGKRGPRLNARVPPSPACHRAPPPPGVLSLILKGPGIPFYGAQLGREPSPPWASADPPRTEASVSVDPRERGPCVSVVVVRTAPPRGRGLLDLRAFPRDLRVTLGSATGDSESQPQLQRIWKASLALSQYNRWTSSACRSRTRAHRVWTPLAYPTPVAHPPPQAAADPVRRAPEPPGSPWLSHPRGNPQGGETARPRPRNRPEGEDEGGWSRGLESMAACLDAANKPRYSTHRCLQTRMLRGLDLKFDTTDIHWLFSGWIHVEHRYGSRVQKPPNLVGPCECVRRRKCTWEGREVEEGHRWQTLSNTTCTCTSGQVACEAIVAGCSYNNLVLINGQTIPDPSNPCSECTCQRGSVVCVKRQCSPALCPHPVTNPCGCPACEGCLYQGVSYLDGQVVSGGTGGCQDCTCSRGAVACVPRRCPAAPCAHPALDGCSCPVCAGCRFTGRDRHNGERFPHPADRCQRCSCLDGGVLCAAAPCPAVSCGRPVTPPGGCCPVCTGSCRHEGGDHPSGSSFTPSRDPCSSCTCLNAAVSCQKRPCPLQCSHPVPSESCCPACDACLYQGGVHAHRRAFGSASDPCQRCTCLQGTVACVRALCPPAAPCPRRAVTPPGQCCPRCPVCMLDGQEYQNGQQWTPQSDPCSRCTCQEGEVRCVSQECPKLPCMHQVQDPGTCCPRCRGCVYDGREHAEASSWFADSASCMNCMCVGGVTTCSQIRCISPCVNTIRVAGECCPLCADCLFEGRVYSPSDSFHPADDPCQVCTCEVMPGGEQHLRCYRKQCPSLVDCPVDNILLSGPESCCPVCAQPLSNCTATLIGNEVLATDDPCFTCQCKDLTWTCLHRNCPPLTCPVSEQLSLPDSCCPVCEECVIEGQDARVPSGSIWTDSDDDCVTCTCNLGHIECSIEECFHLVCQGEQIPMKTPGKCCYECQASGVSCTYQGALYQPGERWAVDECTGCTCVAGDVHCGTERCPPLACSATEMPAAVPGVCCAHCLPRPATCIAFGDPHYRTFDGRMLHFQGACTYVLAQDCQGGDFRIHATNDDRGRKGVSWTKEVTVFIGDLSVQLLQDWVVKVDGLVVALPYLREPYVYVERQTNTILLNTNIGIKVLWSGRSHLEVSVPGSYRTQTCGLCGDFNDFPQDDLRMPDGRLSQSEASFGNSWQVTNHSHALSSCRPGEDVDPCREAGYQARKGANGRCKVLKSAVFKPCHRVVPPEAWHGACVYDLCACGANADECLCDALEAYAGQCREAGVVLAWRSPALC
ncbi:unnamed protein product, partial [Arctogadus glacialis]